MFIKILNSPMSKVIDLDEVDRQKHLEEASHYTNVESKTRIKKDMLEITNFGRKLIDLNTQQLDKLPISDSTKTNIVSAKNMQKIALKRQIQFIGKLLRNSDNLEEIQQSYDSIINKDKQTNLVLLRLENIRDNLLDSDKSASTLNKIISDKPSIDIQRLRQLIRNHHKEQKICKTFKIFQRNIPNSKKQLYLTTKIFFCLL